MDTSFDAFGAGGWGADQADEFQASQAHRSSSFEKLTMPVTIKDLVANTSDLDADQETFKIGSYVFKTIRVIGRVANFSIEGDNVATYELIPYDGDLKTSRRFTVIRHLGNDQDLSCNREQTYQVSTIGLLRIFNNRLSLLSFHIRDSSEEEAEQFNLDCKIAKYYYKQNMPDLSVFQMENYKNTFFCSGTINKGGQQGGGMTQSFNTQNSIRQMDSMHTSSQQVTGLPPKQQRIFEYITKHSISETGVSADDIKRALNLPNVSEEISQLLGDGRIYSTIDDDHYAPVNN